MEVASDDLFLCGLLVAAILAGILVIVERKQTRRAHASTEKSSPRPIPSTQTEIRFETVFFNGAPSITERMADISPQRFGETARTMLIAQGLILSDTDEPTITSDGRWMLPIYQLDPVGERQIIGKLLTNERIDLRGRAG